MKPFKPGKPSDENSARPISPQKTGATLRKPPKSSRPRALEPQTVTKHGKPAVVILAVDEYERLRTLQPRFLRVEEREQQRMLIRRLRAARGHVQQHRHARRVVVGPIVDLTIARLAPSQVIVVGTDHNRFIYTHHNN